MGYATVKRVPRVFNHRHAKQVHDNAVPIRGRVPEIRPLGNRKDVGTYSVRMNGDDVEFVLYRTPVITYKPDGVIVLRTDGWASVSSHQFIQQVLGIPARGKSGSSVLIVNGQHYTMTGDSTLTLRQGEGTGTWRVLEHETLYGYKASRKAITNVRSRYSEFRKYLGGFVNLRREEQVFHQGRPYELRANVLKFGVQEAVDMFGVMDSTYNDAKALDRSKIDCIFTKPAGITYFNPTETQKQDHRDAVRRYEENMKAFTDTIVNGQPEDVKHQNFYRGAMAFLIEGYRYQRANAKAEWVLHSYEQGGVVNVNEWMLDIDEAILKYHAEEVLEHVALEVGKTPNPKYASWISEIV
jgi:hypothetical protein